MLRLSLPARAAGLAGALLLTSAALGGVAVAGSAGATSSSPNDPLWPHQWNLRQVQAPAAWSVSTGQGVRIGIVDTGIDLTHEDLAAKVVASASCIGANGNPSACNSSPGAAQDDNGHGTHVAGIAAAATNNGLGVAGMAPGAQLVVAKSLDSTGSGTYADVDAGIEWVVDHGAKVVNLSLGDSTPLLDSLLGGSSSLASGISYAWSHGAVPVLAAGNTNFLGLGGSDYASTSAVVVGASGSDGQVASYSSPTGNAAWAILAPGGDGQSGGQPDCSTPADQARCILSTYWFAGQTNQYAYDEGTSMAVPAVSGTAALLMALGRTPQQTVDAMLSSADHAVGCGAGSPTCVGLLDAAAAVGAGAGQGSAPAVTTPATSPSTIPVPGSTTTAGSVPPRPSAPVTTHPVSAGSRSGHTSTTSTTVRPVTSTTAPPRALAPTTVPGATAINRSFAFPPNAALAHPFVEAIPAANGQPSSHAAAVGTALGLLALSVLAAAGLGVAHRRRPA